MSVLRYGCASLSTLILAMGCGGRTGESAPAETGEQSSSSPAEESSTAAGGAGSSSDTETTSSGEMQSSAPVRTSEGAATDQSSTVVPGPTDDPPPTRTDSDQDGGMAAVPPIEPGQPLPGPACAGQCGNHMVDSCETCGVIGEPSGGDPVRPAPGEAAPPMEFCTSVSEQCDGELSEEQTCQALGFTGGTLACGDVCRYDDARCESCGTDPSIAVCRDDLGVATQPTRVALATNSVDLVAVWNEGCKLQMGWFDSNLELTHSAELVDAPCLTQGGITLASLGQDWVVEAGAKRYFVEASGATQRSVDLEGTALFAAPRDGDTPLLVRQEAYGVVTATLLEPTGDEAWKTEVSEGVVEAQYGSAAAVEDGFLVALRTDLGVQVFQLEADTGSIAHTSTPGSESTEYPQIGVAGTEVRLVWADFGGVAGVRWARLDTTGEALGATVTIGETPDFFNRSPIVVDGTDTVVLLGGYTGGTGIGKATTLRRLDDMGDQTAGDVAIQSDPNKVQWPQVVAFDGAFVTAWVGNGTAGRVGLAKVNL